MRWLRIAALGAACSLAMPLHGQGAVEAVPQAGATPAAARQAPTGLYRISGFVLSAADSHALRNATVQIQPSQGQPGSPQRTTTDENGYFSFSGLPAGMFNLQGSAEGYLQTMYEQHGIFSTGIVTGAAVDTESLVLKLQPQAHIWFTVIDENGEPVEHANVHLFREGRNFGEDRRVSAGVGSTDDLGRYEFSRLQPGTYFAAVTAQPWYAVHPNAQRGQPGMPFGFMDSIDPSVDVAYPLTYYPGVTESAEAAAIEVRGGEEVKLQVQLRPEPALSITVPLPADEPPQPGPGALAARRMNAIPQVFANIFGQPVPMPTQETRNNGGDAVITGLAPGEYSLTQGGRMPMSRNQGTPVRLSDHSVSTALSSSDVAHVTVQLRAGNGDSAARAQVMLMHDHRVEMSQPVNDKGVASFDAPPGEYYFAVAGRGRPMYVRQVLRGDRPLGSNNIPLAAGQSVSYTIAAVAGTHTVRGVAQVGGSPAHGVLVLLLPTAELHNIHTTFRQQSDLDGSFQFAGVPPGDYTLFAIQDGWTVNWSEPSILDQYVPGATAVHIAEDAPPVQMLPAPVKVQAR